MPVVSVPDLAAQMRADISEEIQNLSVSDIEKIRTSLLTTLSRSGMNNADVRIQFFIASRGRKTLNIGIWSSQSDDPEVNLSRDFGLQFLRLLGENNTWWFGFFINTSFLNEQARQAFERMPKQYSLYGNPDNRGSIHISSLAVKYKEPDKVITIIKGSYDNTWPDTDFTKTITETISIHDFKVNCKTENDTDISFSFTTVLAAITSLAIPFLLPFAIDALTVDQKDITGLGKAASLLVPETIPLKNREALVFLYLKSKVTQGGLFFNSLMEKSKRFPAVFATGPVEAIMYANQSDVRLEFRARATDTFGNVTFRWTTNNSNVIIENYNSWKITAKFKRAGSGSSATFTRSIKVSVYDEDGLIDTKTITVTIKKRNSNSNDIPPICIAKPWLPVCQI
jgi:ribosomal protein L21E